MIIALEIVLNGFQHMRVSFRWHAVTIHIDSQTAWLTTFERIHYRLCFEFQRYIVLTVDFIILLNFWSIVVGLLDPGGCAFRDGMKYRMYWFFLSFKFQCCTLSCYSGFLGVHRNFKSIRF